MLYWCCNLDRCILCFFYCSLRRRRASSVGEGVNSSCSSAGEGNCFWWSKIWYCWLTQPFWRFSDYLTWRHWRWARSLWTNSVLILRITRCGGCYASMTSSELFWEWDSTPSSIVVAAAGMTTCLAFDGSCGVNMESLSLFSHIPGSVLNLLLPLS